MAAGTASSSGRGSPAMATAISSESDVEPSFAPSASSSMRSSFAFTRLPLWARATLRLPRGSSGWAFAHVLEPVVEYRVWPMASLAPEAAELLLREVRDQAELLQDRQPPAVRDGDARRLLAPVLERVQREMRQPRDIAVRGVDAEDAAHQPTVPISISSMPSSLPTSPGAQARIAAASAGASISAKPLAPTS